MKKNLLVLASLTFLASSLSLAKHQFPAPPADTNTPTFQSGTVCSLLDANEKELATTPWVTLLKIFTKVDINGRLVDTTVTDNEVKTFNLEIVGKLDVIIQINKNGFGSFDIAAVESTNPDATLNHQSSINFKPTRHRDLVHFAPAFTDPNLAGVHINCVRN